ncbi:MAG: hypothetical protein ACRDU4_14515, partial [Mycobacterium sp.]
LRPGQLRPWEAALFIECTWRISDGTFLVASSADGHEPERSEYGSLSRVIGLAVSQCSFRPPFFDLSVTFDTGLQLDVFCDQVGDERCANYTVETFDYSGTVAAEGRVIIIEKESIRPLVLAHKPGT